MSISTDYYNNSYQTHQTAHMRKPSVSSLIDQNGDMILDADELSGFAAEYQKTGSTIDLSAVMSTYDSDGDGSLSQDEQKAMNKERALEKLLANGNQMLKRKMTESNPLSQLIDNDSNMIWSTEEITQFVDKINAVTEESLDIDSVLSKYDLDGDGALDQEEQVQMMKDMAPPPPMRRVEFPLSADSSETTENETSTVDSSRKSLDDSEIRRIIREVYEEMISKKEEEVSLIDEANANAEANKLSLANFAMKKIDSYERFFFYENTNDIFKQFNA